MQVYTGIDWSESEQSEHSVMFINEADVALAQLTIPHTSGRPPRHLRQGVESPNVAEGHEANFAKPMPYSICAASPADRRFAEPVVPVGIDAMSRLFKAHTPFPSR
jgi:hypothetical protein